MNKFKFLDSMVTADLAFEAFGRDYDELFENAGLALESAQVDLKSVDPNRVKKIKLESDSIENLLFSFLEELIFLKDAEQMLFNRIKCEVEEMENPRSELGSKAGKWTVESRISGEKIDPQKHKLGVDVKAVTKHLFEIGQVPGKNYRCQVILDV